MRNSFTPTDAAVLQAMHARADKIRAMIHWRAIEAYHAAFGAKAKQGDTLCMCVIGNSLIDADAGKPWREMDVAAMRRARWLCDKSFEPSRIVTAWYRRKCGIAA